MGNPSQIDLAGNELVVDTLRVGATTPGAQGTALSSTELSLLDGVTAGSITASKVVTADSSSQVPYRRKFVDDALTLTLTAAQSGALVRLDKTDGVTVTLPAPAIGLTYDFYATATTASGNYKIITDAGTTFLVGTVAMFDTDTLTDPLSVATANGTTHIACTMNGSTTGGLLGTRIRVTCVSSTLWAIEGFIHHSGAVATPFATS